MIYIQLSVRNKHFMTKCNFFVTWCSQFILKIPVKHQSSTNQNPSSRWSHQWYGTTEVLRKYLMTTGAAMLEAACRRRHAQPTMSVWRRFSVQFNMLLNCLDSSSLTHPVHCGWVQNTRLIGGLLLRGDRTLSSLIELCYTVITVEI